MLAAIKVQTNRLPPRVLVASLYGSLLIALAIFVSFASPLKAISTEHFSAVLETRIPRAAFHPEVPVSGIIVLGGSPVRSGSPTRIDAAMKLAKKFPEAAIILSGPGSNEVAAATTILPLRMNTFVDRRPKNTYENALYSRELINPSQRECWILVTSAMHMPRAIGVFQAAGVPVSPWPVSDTPQSFDEKHNWLRHELIGLLGYWLVGRTREIYPSYRSSGCHPETAQVD